VRPPIDGGVVLVTGASSGLGVEMARILARRARVLILAARRKDRMEALAAELRGLQPNLQIEIEPCDLADSAQTVALADRLLARHQAIDVLVNNAGLGDVGLFDRADWRKFRLVIGVNVEALTLLTYKLLPPMIQRGRGGILNVSSGFGLNWMPGVAVYAASKHYVTAFTDSLRVELSGTGVVVTQLCPGPVPTEFEEVAGNPVGMSVPGIVQVSPARVARTAIAGFDRGRAMIIPGVIISFLITLGAFTPRWILRLLYGWMGPALRKKARA
jgi:uncharacterized protein